MPTESVSGNPWVFYAAIVTAFASIVALVVNVIFGEISKRRQRVWEGALTRCDEQIGKLYAPLENLVEQLDITDELKKEMIEQDPTHSNEISKLCYDSYFVPIHNKIALLLESQLHLLEDEDIPKSFIDYYKHVASERVFFSLVENIDQAKRHGTLPDHAQTVTCKPFPYPEPDFKNAIKAGFEAVLKRQEHILSMIIKSQPSLKRVEEIDPLRY